MASNDDVSSSTLADVDVVESGKASSRRGGSTNKRKRTPPKQKGEKAAPKPKEVSKLTGLYLTAVAPALAKQKEKEVKFNLRSIDDHIADDGVSKQQFLALLHFIDQPSLVVSEFEFRQDVPYAITGAGVAKVLKMTKEVNECKETMPEQISSRMLLIQERFSQDRYKLPAFDRETILKCQEKGNGCVRIILTKTTLETFIDQRARNESVPTNKKPKQIRFLGAYFRYEPVFDVVFDDAEAKKVTKKRKKQAVRSTPATAEEEEEEEKAAIDSAVGAVSEELKAEEEGEVIIHTSDSDEEDDEVKFQKQ
jgi:hypothetical protein